MSYGTIDIDLEAVTRATGSSACTAMMSRDTKRPPRKPPPERIPPPPEKPPVEDPPHPKRDPVEPPPDPEKEPVKDPPKRRRDRR